MDDFISVLVKLQDLPPRLLSQIASGEFDVKEVAKILLETEGLDADGYPIPSTL